MTEQQMIFYGRQVSKAKASVLIQDLYIQGGSIIVETKLYDTQGVKNTRRSTWIVTKKEAYTLARANYVEKLIEFGERGLLGNKAYREQLDLLHSRAALIGGVKAE